MSIQIGEKLKQARSKLRMTVREVAEKLDVDYSYISKIENEHVTPSLEMVKKLADFYGMSLSEIFSNEPDNSLSTLNEILIINKLNEISETLKQMQQNQVSPEWLEVIEYCQKENLNPKKVLELLKFSVELARENKKK